MNKWTIALAAAGVVSFGAFVQAEEAAKNQVQTLLSSTTLSGYVSSSAIWKFGTGNNNMPGRSYDGVQKQDGFNLDVVKLSLEKPLDEGNWSAGYRVDMLFGPDAYLYNPSFATDFGDQNGNGVINNDFNFADFGLQQAYVDLRAPIGNGLDFKVGTFDTCIGYEVFDSWRNPNYSRSYGYFIEPLSHTGLLASYQVAEWLSVSAGVANTWNTGINARPTRGGGAALAAESDKTYLGSIALTAPESFGALKGATLYAGIVDGIDSSNDNTDTTSYYVGATVPTPLEGLAVGASYDYRGTKNKNGIASTYANATGAYVSYQATEKLKLNLRGEYASGSIGTWDFNTVKAAGGADNEQFLGVTTTVDYALWANVITRAEFRWDHDMSGGQPAFGGVNAFGGDKNALSLALNVIYKF